MGSARGGSPLSWNRYSYTRGDPTNRKDPTGLEDDGGDGDPDMPAQDLCGDGGCDDFDDAGVIASVTVTATPPPNPEPNPCYSADSSDGCGGGAVGGSAQAGGGNTGGSTFSAAKGLFISLARTISKMTKFKPNCNSDFVAVGTTASAITAGAASAVFFNGDGSTVSLASTYANSPIPGVAQAGSGLSGTVGSYIASNPGTVALAQLGAPGIYLNASLINTGNYYQDISVLLHELLHNVTGLTDPDIQSAFGLSTSAPSDNITQKLLKDCF